MDNPHFIKATDLLLKPLPMWEFHVHTNFTDGKNSVQECVDQAVLYGMEKMVFTEHTEPWQSHENNWFGQYRGEIESVRSTYGEQIEIIIGLEAPAISFDGDLEMTDEMRESVEFVLGAAHRYPSMKDGERVRDLSPERALELEYETLKALCKSKEVEAIAHIGATCMKYCGPFPLDLSREIIREATTAGKAIEINQSYHQPLDDYLNLCIEEEAWIIPGSNAHKAEAIGSVYRAISKWQNEKGIGN